MDTEALPPFPKPPLTIALSECLTGAQVRYDGGNKREAMPHAALDGMYVLRAICPEMGIGLGVPRDPIRLVGDPDAPRARVFRRAAGVVRERKDVTAELRAYADSQLPLIDDVDGYVFMQASPSCGVSGVTLFGSPNTSRGVYAAQVLRRRPALPATEGGWLFDPAHCANFVLRTFVYAHWRRTRTPGITAAKLIAFHTAYKYLLMAHDVQAYRRLGRQLSDLSGTVAPVDMLAERYIHDLLRALSRPASRSGHANALAHLQGYVGKGRRGAPPSHESRMRALADLIEAYRLETVPLSVPMSRLRRELLDAGATYALNQTYLRPDLWAAVDRAYDAVRASSQIGMPNP